MSDNTPDDPVTGDSITVHAGLSAGNFSDSADAQPEFASVVSLGSVESVITMGYAGLPSGGSGTDRPLKSASSSVKGRRGDIPVLSSDDTPHEPLPQQSSSYASETEVVSVHRAFLFATYLTFPLNFFATVNLPAHDAWGKGERLLKKSLWDSLGDLWRLHNFGPFRAVWVFENGDGGGRGLHMHLLAHVPPARYGEFVACFSSVFAKRYTKALRGLLSRYSEELAEIGLRLPRRATMPEIHAALVTLRTRKRSSFPDAKTKEDARIRNRIVGQINLPFFIQDDCVTAPLTPDKALRKLRYMCKSIDPTIRTTRLGVPTTIAALSIEEGFGEQGFGIRLEKQSSRRFASGNMGSTKTLGIAAQQAHGFIAPKLSIGDWLEPRAAHHLLQVSVQALLSTLHDQKGLIENGKASVRLSDHLLDPEQSLEAMLAPRNAPISDAPITDTPNE